MIEDFHMLMYISRGSKIQKSSVNSVLCPRRFFIPGCYLRIYAVSKLGCRNFLGTVKLDPDILSTRLFWDS